MSEVTNEKILDSIQQLDEGNEVDEDDSSISREVPLSDADVMGFILEDANEDFVVLELGYLKNTKEKEIIIDVRKRLPPAMAKDLYAKLKKHFEK